MHSIVLLLHVMILVQADSNGEINKTFFIFISNGFVSSKEIFLKCSSDTKPGPGTTRFYEEAGCRGIGLIGGFVCPLRQAVPL